MNAHAKILPVTVTIDQLKPGSERPGGSINSRKDYAAADIKARLESILAFGILRPLMVMPAPDTDQPPFYVADGGLSREAVALGVKDKKLPKDYPVKISVLDGDGALALAASLEANEQVLPPHPVKVFEAFAELQARGKTVDEIAIMFRLKPKDVRGYLALGALSPKIRKAWIDGEIDEDAAKVFTLATDHKQQDAAFDKIKKGGKWQLRQENVIRNALVGDQDDADEFLKFVGKDAYEAAGGKVIEDLFGEGHAVSDPAMLKNMADEKITGKCAELTALGWKWAEPVTNENHYAEHSWQTVKDGKNASDKAKATAGCRVGIDSEGRFAILYGLIRPGDVKKTAKATGSAKAKEAPKGPAKISNSLDYDLDVMSARAIKDAVAADKHSTTLAKVLAGIVAQQITPDRYNYMPQAVRKGLNAMREAVTPKVMMDALVKHFNAKRYFPSAPKPFVIKAITEAGFPAEAKKLAAGTKAAAWKWALANVPRTGWLPPELRTVHYRGPGVKKAR